MKFSNEDLKEIAEKSLGMDAELARELLSLRTVEGDDEITRLEQDLAKLKADYAFSQQQLREAQSEVERLKGCQEVDLFGDLVQGFHYWLITDWNPEWQVWEYVGNDEFGCGAWRVRSDDVQKIRGPIHSPEQE